MCCRGSESSTLARRWTSRFAAWKRGVLQCDGACNASTCGTALHPPCGAPFLRAEDGRANHAEEQDEGAAEGAGRQCRCVRGCHCQCLRVRVWVRVSSLCAFMCMRPSPDPSESDSISFPFPRRHRDGHVLSRSCHSCFFDLRPAGELTVPADLQPRPQETRGHLPGLGTGVRTSFEGPPRPVAVSAAAMHAEAHAQCARHCASLQFLKTPLSANDNLLSWEHAKARFPPSSQLPGPGPPGHSPDFKQRKPRPDSKLS